MDSKKLLRTWCLTILFSLFKPSAATTEEIVSSEDLFPSLYVRTGPPSISQALEANTMDMRVFISAPPTPATT